MKVIQSRATEFYELVVAYSEHPQGKDVVAMVRQFADEFDHFDAATLKSSYREAWEGFAEEHRNDATLEMFGVVIYVLLTYWEPGERLYESMGPTDKLLLREMVSKMDYEIRQRSAQFNGNDPVPA